MTEYIEKLKRYSCHYYKKTGKYCNDGCFVCEQDIGYNAAIDELHSCGLIVQDGFTPMPNEATREIDNAYHSALPCTFDVAYRAMIATQKKED